jgi:ATP-binding cassette subfamily C protein CydC
MGLQDEGSLMGVEGRMSGMGGLRGAARRVVGAGVVGIVAELAGIGLAATAAWLVVSAAGQPPLAALTVAIVVVRTLAIARGGLRYAERLVGHGAVLKLLAELRGRVYAALVRRRDVRDGDALTRVAPGGDLLTKAAPDGDTPPKPVFGEDPLKRTGSEGDALTQAVPDTDPPTTPAPGGDPLTEASPVKDAPTQAPPDKDPIARAAPSGDTPPKAASSGNPLTRTAAEEDALTAAAPGGDPLTKAALERHAPTQAVAGNGPLVRAASSGDGPSKAAAGEDPLTRAVSEGDALTEAAPGEDPLTKTAPGGDSLTKAAPERHAPTQAVAGNGPLVRAAPSGDAPPKAAAGGNPLTRTEAEADAPTEAAPGGDPLTKAAPERHAPTRAVAGKGLVVRAAAGGDGPSKAAVGEDPVTRVVSEGDALTRVVADVDAVQDAVLRCIVPAFVAVCVGGAGLVVTAFVDGAAAWVLGCGLGLMVLVAAGAGWVARRGAEVGVEARVELAEHMVDLVRGADELEVYGAREGKLREADRAAAEIVVAEKGSGSGLRAAGVVVAMGTVLALVVVLPGGAVSAGAAVSAGGAGSASGAVSAAVVLGVLAGMEVFLALIPAATVWASVRPAVRRVVELLTGAGAARRVAVDVEVDLRPGKHTAIVGPSGAGKSTLLAEIAHRNPDARGAMADAHVFAVSMRDNLSFAGQDLAGAAKLAGLDEWIDELPDGWDTPISAETISGGQRQRLVLARALVGYSPVLLLDEPVEGLEVAQGDRVLADVLAAAEDRAVVLVTHRLSQLEGFDDIVVLEEGRVVQRGSHTALIAEPGYYRDSWEAERMTNR